jgi:guanylate kinase
MGVKMLLMLIGKSGTGKTSIINNLNRFKYAPSYTTRPPRKNDDKIYIEHNEFCRILDEFIEYTEYNNYWYGRKKADILLAKNENLIVDIEPIGLYKYTEFCNLHNIPYITIYLKCDESERLKRIKNDKIRISRIDNYFEDAEWFKFYDIILDTSKFTINEITQIIQCIIVINKKQNLQVI